MAGTGEYPLPNRVPPAHPSAVRTAWLFLDADADHAGAGGMAAGPHHRWSDFTDANLSDLSSARFVGFENYLVHDEGEMVWGAGRWRSGGTRSGTR